MTKEFLAWLRVLQAVTALKVATVVKVARDYQVAQVLQVVPVPSASFDTHWDIALGTCPLLVWFPYP